MGWGWLRVPVTADDTTIGRRRAPPFQETGRW